MKKGILLLTLTLISVVASVAQNSFWGVTSKGGSNNAGVIYQTDMDGTNQVIKFQSKLINDAYMPSEYTGMTEYPATGELFGVTEEGGTGNVGVFFKYNPTSGIFTKLFDFTGENGKRPHGGLILATNDKIYGTTKDSDADTTFPAGNGGSIFEFDPAAETFKTVYKFDDINGKSPYAKLYQASNGKIYGTTSGGGNNSKGVLFEYSIGTTSINIIHHFSSGQAPYGGVVEANGKLYGATSLGGLNGKGIIYEYNLSNNTFTKKVDFSTTHSGYMKGEFIVHNNSLYGVTNGNQQVTGAYGKLIKYIPGETTSSVVHSFMLFTSGGYPIGGLTKVESVLIGTLTGGPLTPRGSIFEFDLDASQSSAFSYTAMSSIDQIDLKGTLVNASKGIFGLTKSSGSTNNGSIYKYNRTDSPKSIEDVLSFKIDEMGSNPVGKLTRSSDGKLYGNMSTGGKYRSGVLFSYNPLSDAYTVEYDFPASSKPNGSMVLVGNRRLYGMSEKGGNKNQGYIFEYKTSNKEFTIIHHFNTTLADNQTFNDANLGALPKGGFTALSDSILYGTTSKGGFANDGMLFKIVVSEHLASMQVEKLVSCDVLTGSEPSGDLELDGEYLYGMTYTGGTIVPGGGQGTIFRYKINGNYEPLVALMGGANGEYPSGSLTKAGSSLYGFTHGQINNITQLGVLLEYNPANPYSHAVHHEFVGSTSEGISKGGSKPFGKMTLSTNEKLYGTASLGSGISGTGGHYGVLFEFDPTTNAYKSVQTFTGPNGASPSVNAELSIICAVDASVTVNQAENELIANESGAASYQWYSVNTNSNVRTLIPDATEKQYAPLLSGTYSVEVEKDGCSNISDYYFLEVIVCNTDASFTLNESTKTFIATEANATAYQWYEINITNQTKTAISIENKRSFTPTKTGTYALEVTKDNCASFSNNQYFEFIPECNVNVSVDFDAENKIFTALETTADGYQWFSVNTVNNQTTQIAAATERAFAPNETGYYLVEITMGACSDVSENLYYEHVVQCNIDTSLVFDQDLDILTASQGNANYQWFEKLSDGTTTSVTGENQRIFSPTKTGIYFVEITMDACNSFSEAYTYTEICKTNASVSYDYDSKLFVANEANATAYQWYEVKGSDPETITAINGANKRSFSPISSGSYKLEVTKNGCANYSDTYAFEKDATCNTDATANFNSDLKIFIAKEANAEAYQWYEIINESLTPLDGQSGRSYTPYYTGEYVVEVSKNGCSNYSDPISYDHITVCSTDASASYNEGLKIFIANEPSANKYQWFEVDDQGGLLIIANATQRTYTPAKSANYKLEVTKGGCSNFSETYIFDLAADCQTDASISYKADLQLFIANEPDASDYQWFEEAGNGNLIALNGENNRSFTPTKTGKFSVEVSKNGCANVSESMYFEHVDECNTIAAIYYRKSNNSLEATETNADSYAWYIENIGGKFELIPGASSRIYLPKKSGNYKVKVVKNNCDKLSTNHNYIHYVTCSLNVTISLDESKKTLVASEENASYQWYEWLENTQELIELENEMQQLFTPIKSGKYLVEITVDQCSDFSSPKTFEFFEPCILNPIISINTEQTSMSVVPLGAETYQWYAKDLATDELTIINGANTASLKPVETGNYVCEVSRDETCTALSNVLYFELPPICDLDVTIRYNKEQMVLEANILDAMNYQWYIKKVGNSEPTPLPWATTVQLNPQESGTYICEVITDENCSEFSEEMYYEKPGNCELFATLDLDDELMVLKANSLENVTYSWHVLDINTGEMLLIQNNAPSIFTPDETGTYAVVLENNICSVMSPSVFFEKSSNVFDNINVTKAHIYPNPASGYLFINTKLDIKRIEIMSLSGSTISNINSSGNTMQINVSNYKNGMYFVRIDYKNGSSETLRFMKRSE